MLLVSILFSMSLSPGDSYTPFVCACVCVSLCVCLYVTS